MLLHVLLVYNPDADGNAEAQIDFARQELDCKQFKNCPARWTIPRFWYAHYNFPFFEMRAFTRYPCDCIL
jgi:hypothetical protein